jgi:uncharacterized membrane protein
MLIAAIIFVVIDSVYLNLAKGYFSNQVQKVQNSAIKLNYVATFICYLFLITGLNYFIIKPNKTPSDAFLLGIVIYGVYETTNLALFSNWSWLTAIMDTLWGGLLFATTTFIVRGLKRI